MEPSFEQQIPIVPIVIGFLALLIFTNILRRRMRKRYLRSEGRIDIQNGRIPSIEERVAANRAWAKGEIKSKGGMLMAGVWLIAIVWNLTFGVSFFKQLSNPDIKTGGLVVLGFFALFGLPAIGFAIYMTKKYLRFGESLCRITGKAGVIGKGIKGAIRTKSAIKPEGDFTVMLQCVECYSVGTGNNRTSKTEVHWQGSQKIPRETVNSRVGIPFSIDIPNYPPETGYQISRGPINWQLSVTAPMEGVDYSAMFIVPVFKMD